MVGRALLHASLVALLVLMAAPMSPSALACNDPGHGCRVECDWGLLAETATGDSDVLSCSRLDDTQFTVNRDGLIAQAGILDEEGKEQGTPISADAAPGKGFAWEFPVFALGALAIVAAVLAGSRRAPARTLALVLVAAVALAGCFRTVDDTGRRGLAEDDHVTDGRQGDDGENDDQDEDGSAAPFAPGDAGRIYVRFFWDADKQDRANVTVMAEVTSADDVELEFTETLNETAMVFVSGDVAEVYFPFEAGTSSDGEARVGVVLHLVGSGDPADPDDDDYFRGELHPKLATPAVVPDDDGDETHV